MNKDVLLRNKTDSPMSQHYQQKMAFIILKRTVQQEHNALCLTMQQSSRMHITWMDAWTQANKKGIWLKSYSKKKKAILRQINCFKNLQTILNGFYLITYLTRSVRYEVNQTQIYFNLNQIINTLNVSWEPGSESVFVNIFSKNWKSLYFLYYFPPFNLIWKNIENKKEAMQKTADNTSLKHSELVPNNSCGIN